VKPGEIVEIAVKPSRPFNHGCVYEIMVGTFWYWEGEGDEEGISGVGIPHYIGAPAAYLYRNGRLEELQARKVFSVGQSAVEKKFCISCGGEILPSAKYCPMCGEKQDLEISTWS
jgi:hypothetical protein